MALSSTTTLEVETTGSDNNGGGYDGSGVSPGTDYTYGLGQAVYTYTDLVIGATATQLTSVARPFSGADNCNTLQVSGGAGFTLGTYLMTSESGVTATFDRAVGTAASTGGTGNLGGALATPGKAFGVAVTGNNVWLKSATYACTSSANNVSGGVMTVPAGSFASGAKFEGYGTARGDKASRPVITDGTATSANIVTSGSACTIDNIEIVAATASNTCLRVANNNVRVIRCKTSGSGNGIVVAGSQDLILDCWFTNTCANPVSVTTASCSIICCAATGGTGSGFLLQTSFPILRNCLSYANGGSGFEFQGSQASHAAECVAWGNAVDGFRWSANANSFGAMNCVAAYNSGYGFNASAGVNDALFLLNCATIGNLAAVNNINRTEGMITLSVTPFNNAGAGDFGINNTPGGGTLLRAAAFPGISVQGSASFRDAGAFQHQDAPQPVIAARRIVR